MSNVYLDDSILTGIGNAIRAKTGGNSLITPANMATAISNISTSGGDLTISRVFAGMTQCKYNNFTLDYILPIGDYLPNNLNKLKAIIGVSDGNSGYSAIWYNNSFNLINATVSQYVDSNGVVKNDAGTVPILINPYIFKTNYGTGEDNSNNNTGYALINNQLYTITLSGDDYIYNSTPYPSYTSGSNIDWFIIKEV